MAFASFILVGTLLLSLPFAHEGAPHKLVDDFFMAASAICVTGLVTIDTGASYSTFGESVIMLLIQIGGLGYMTLFTVSMLIVGRRLSMRDRITLQQATDQPGMAGMVAFFTNIVKFTAVVEGIGFLLLSFYTVPEFGWKRGLYMALFHSISAFNNAGFSLFSESAMHWQSNGVVLGILVTLVIIGGLGYSVNRELVNRLLFRRQPNHRWDILMKIVLGLTVVLLIGGMLLFWYFEANNPKTLAGLPWHAQLANSFFMSAMPRTAGFNSVDVASLDRPTIMMTLVLMFIGAGPGGTAGGIKLTTIAIIIAAILSSARGQDEVTLFNLKRTISEKHVLKAFTVMTVSLGVVVLTAILLASFEKHAFLPILFEAISAFGTVGLSMGVTGDLTTASKLVIIATMLTGRVGVLVILLSVITHRRKTSIKYMEEPLLIG